jgi:SAM-dependent methyltransferase
MTDGVSARATPGCVVCGTSLVAHLAVWLKRCPRCGLRASSLAEDVVSAHTPGAWDEHNAAALAALREQTAQRLLDELAQLTALREIHLLDVGCGPAWFLAAAQGRCASVIGLEPDAASAAQARQRGLAVSHGRFPEQAPDGPFDVVSFNDVFEHLPAPALAAASLERLLSERGLVVITAPSRQGFFYRIAERLARCGVNAPLERMWQRGFVSPHLYYYEPATLDALFTRHGFQCVRGFELPSVSRSGLWARIVEGRRLPLMFAIVIYLACRLLLPVLHLLPADIQVRIYARSPRK